MVLEENNKANILLEVAESIIFKSNSDMQKKIDELSRVRTNKYDLEKEIDMMYDQVFNDNKDIHILSYFDKIKKIITELLQKKLDILELKNRITEIKEKEKVYDKKISILNWEKGFARIEIEKILNKRTQSIKDIKKSLKTIYKELTQQEDGV